MRVLHVTPYFAPAFRYGGPPRSVLGLCHGLQRAGVDVEVVTTAANGSTDLPSSPPDGSEYEGIAVHYTPVAFPRRLFGGRLRGPLSSALADADLCHIHGIWNVPEWTASRLARTRRVPYVISPRGMLQPGALRHGLWRKRAAFRLFERATLAGAEFLHATSSAEAAILQSLNLTVPIVNLANGVDVVAASRAAPDFRLRLGIGRDAFVVLFLGRIHPIKRLDLVADAFAALRARHSAAHLVLAGPDERGHLAEIMTRLTAHAGFVHATDAVSEHDKWSLLRDVDALVLCSDSESFGLVVVEAMAAAVPVVVTRTCPWDEVETHGCGFSVEQSVAAIAAALRELAADRALAAGMGARGAAFVRDRYSWDAIGRQMAARYFDVLGRRRDDRVA
jgi:glycosyltransferase involved in cell wall biosynthesis